MKQNGTETTLMQYELYPGHGLYWVTACEAGIHKNTYIYHSQLTYMHGFGMWEETSKSIKRIEKFYTDLSSGSNCGPWSYKEATLPTNSSRIVYCLVSQKVFHLHPYCKKKILVIMF